MNSIFKIKKIIYKYFPFIVNVKNTIANRKRKASYGKENPDKIFYVFGCKDDTGGLWWHINKSLMHIAYAVDNGYIAVIDMQNFHNQYTEDSKFGKINVWEIFFQQPMGYTLEDIAHSKNIILSKKAPYPNHKYWMGQSEFYDNEDRIKYFHNLFSKYIKFNNKTKEYLQKQYENILSGKGRVVGVLCRGTDYVLYRPKGHPVQPEPQDVIKDVKNVMASYRCEYVFLSTEDSDIFKLFLEEFGNKLLYVEQKRTSKSDLVGGMYLAKKNIQDSINIDTFTRGIGYLSSTYLLSQCTCYLGGRTGGSKGVLLMSNGFEYRKIYNLGLYD